MTETFSAEVFSLGSNLYSGEVVAVSSKNELGPFDILDLHSNFISLIQEKITLHLANGGTKDFKVTSGVLRCLETHVSVYLAEFEAQPSKQ